MITGEEYQAILTPVQAREVEVGDGWRAPTLVELLLLFKVGAFFRRQAVAFNMMDTWILDEGGECHDVLIHIQFMNYARAENGYIFRE